MSMLVEDRPLTFSSKLADLAEVALRGLRATYGAVGGLPYTMHCRDGTFQPEGHSVRYALISLLGLDVAKPIIGKANDLSDTLWHRIVDSGLHDTFNAGDYGLGLWATALHNRADSAFTARRALTELRRDPSLCDSVDLAWLLLGAEHHLQAGHDNGDADTLLDVAKQHLLKLWSPEVSLFYRHPRGGPVSSVSRRIACFANQIYPLMALSVHAIRTGCAASRGVVAMLTDNLCRLQGPRGQWWWLYDARDGGVVDGYPVYSVHQDGMALMGLIWAGRVLARDMSEPLDRSLQWLFGHNEREEQLIVELPGLILRDVHRAGVGRVQRMVEGTLYCWGKNAAWNSRGRADAFRVNAECRPYHLGWVLYAAGLANR
jgi:hypothetical protein